MNKIVARDMPNLYLPKAEQAISRGVIKLQQNGTKALLKRTDGKLASS